MKSTFSVVLFALAVPVTWATTWAPSEVIQCPGSKSLRERTVMASGNTVGATIWSDGYMDAPMLPRSPIISRCAPDGVLYRVDKAKRLGRLSSMSNGRFKGQKVLQIEQPSESDLIEAAASNLSDMREIELELRLLAWWKSGARAAADAGLPSPRTGAARQNEDRLEVLLDEANDDYRLIKADLLRQQGRFEQALALLRRPLPPSHQAFASWLQSLVERREPRIQQWTPLD